MSVFIDTSYFYARMSAKDQWHARAVKAHPPPGSVTSTFIVNETATLLQTRGFLSTALEFLSRIRAEPGIRIVHIDPVLQAEAWELLARHGSSGANLTDCASFAVMRSQRITRAFSFDEHFRAAGFQILR